MNASPAPQEIAGFAVWSASALLRSKEGREAGYWDKPFLGPARMPGSAYVIGTYTYFILGCALAGASPVQLSEYGTPAVLPEAESLVGYYLEFPPVKQLLDLHFYDTDQYAAQNLSPEMQAIVGDARSMIAKTSVGRPDEAFLTIVWNIVQEGKPFPIDQAVESLAKMFLYGTAMPESEVRRLWGIQASTVMIPMMEAPYDTARAGALDDIADFARTSAS
jgi:hypothetical protein